GQRGPYDDRSAIWRDALRQWEAHPLLGTGPGGFKAIAAQGAGPLAAVRPDHAHDLVLTVAAEQGLLGLTALAAVLLVGGLAVLRAGQCDGGAGEQEMLAGAAAALVTVLGQGLVDYPLRNPVLVAVTWLLVGVLAATVAAARPRPA